MAAPELDVTHGTAGAEYFAAIRKLGLEPDALFWAWDSTVEQMVLVLVTRQFDRVGPLELSRRLFAAYNATATPKEISPFVIRLHSPQQAIIQQVAKLVSVNIRVTSVETGEIEKGFKLIVNGADMQFDPAWVYKFDTMSRRSPADLNRQWKRFDRNVAKLVA